MCEVVVDDNGWFVSMIMCYFDDVGMIFRIVCGIVVVYRFVGDELYVWVCVISLTEYPNSLEFGELE